MRVDFITKLVATGKELEKEDAEVTSIETAEAQIKALIADFNKQEKEMYPDDPRLRELVRIIGEGQAIHDWEKASLIADNGRVFYRCKRCRLKTSVPHSSLSVPAGGECYPDRVCTTCNKQYASAENLEKHKRRKH